MDQKCPSRFICRRRRRLQSNRPGTARWRHAARAALVGAKQVGRAVLVLGVFTLMLAAAMALGLLIWVPHFHVNS
jgi:hypothetical protein